MISVLTAADVGMAAAETDRLWPAGGDGVRR